jgi:hypothetical protein
MAPMNANYLITCLLHERHACLESPITRMPNQPMPIPSHAHHPHPSHTDKTLIAARKTRPRARSSFHQTCTLRNSHASKKAKT